MRRTSLLTRAAVAGGTPLYVSSGAAGVASGITQVDVPVPSGSVGDRLIVFLGANNAGSTWVEATTSDFSSIGTPGSSMAAYTRVASGFEGPTYRFTRATNTTAAAFGVMVRISGVGSVQAVAFTTTTSANPALTGVTAAANNYLLQIPVKPLTGASTWTAPGGTTRQTAAGATASGTALPYAVGDELVGSGATGTRIWSQSGGSSAVRGAVIAINPA